MVLSFTAISLPVRVANENLFFALNLSPSHPHNGNLPIHLLSFYPYVPQLNPGVKVVPVHATDSSPPSWAINYLIGTVVSPSARAFFAFSYLKLPQETLAFPSSSDQMASNKRAGEGYSSAPPPLRPRLG